MIMVMKRIVFTLVCIMLTMGMMAQEKPERRQRQFSPEKYYQHMEEYITKEANLTDSEKTKFFPLFKEMLEAQRKIVGQDREIMKSFKNAKTESEFKNIIEKTTSLQVENKKIEQTYYKKFAKVLTWEKICKVRMAQTKFNMHALKRFSPRQGQHRKGDFNKPWKGNKQKEQQNPTQS